MLLTTTFKLLRKADACMSSYRKLREALIDSTDEEPINLLTILEVLGLEDALWALRATEQNCDKVARLMAADFAEELLPFWIRVHPSDTRPADAIQAARNFAGGLITAEQSSTFSSSAYAAYASHAASSAFSSTFSYAAYAASHAAAASSAYAAYAAYAASHAAAASSAYTAYAAASHAYAYTAEVSSASYQRQEQIFRSYLQA